MTPVYIFLWALLVVVLFAARNRRALRRWWQTKACLTPGCVGRLPAAPLHNSRGLHEPEQCEVCLNWVKWQWEHDRYTRVTPPKEAKS